jgi:hypothetical protein
MGKPEASSRLTTSVRLDGHPAGSPRDVLDQSLARISADMLDVTGMSVSVCRAIDLAKGMFPPVAFQAILINRGGSVDFHLERPTSLPLNRAARRCGLQPGRRADQAAVARGYTGPSDDDGAQVLYVLLSAAISIDCRFSAVHPFRLGFEMADC